METSKKALTNTKFPTPTGKLAFPLSQTKQNLVLVLSGSFFPIHNNHLRTLEKVKEYLDKSPEYNVVGGYILPTHNVNLQRKFDNIFIPPIKRLEMIQLAVADSKWIDVDPFLLMQAKNIGAGQAGLHLETTLNEEIAKRENTEDGQSPKIKTVTVMGVDNITLVEKSLSKNLFIFVQNRPTMSKFDLDGWLSSDKIKPYAHNVIIVQDPDIPYELSSTILREKIVKDQPVDEFIPPKVVEFLKNDANFQNVFKAIQKKVEIQAKNNTSGPSIEEFGLKYDPEKHECLQSFIDFPFTPIPFEDLTPEFLHGQPLKLGKGLAAVVWAMKWKEIPVAVKIFNLSSQRSRKIGSFKLELRSLSRINHKNVVKCIGAGSIGNGIYIVLERAETIGSWSYVTENADMWRKNGYSLEWIKAWAHLAEGLEAMSQADVLHRDLQLDNILLFKEKEGDHNNNDNKNQEEIKEEVKDNSQGEEKARIVFKVSDFGVSSLHIDKHEVIRGSMRHYAPEAIDAKENYTPASDVYSFGLLMYEMIHAKRVWSDVPTSQVITKVLAGTRPDFEVPCHQKVKDVMAACWAQDPKSRPSFKEAAEMLHKVYNELLK